MFRVIENPIVTMQYSVVLLLAIISFQAAPAFRLTVFRLVGLGWLFNLAYLYASNNGRPITAGLHWSDRSVSVLASYFDFVTFTSFWYAAHKSGQSRRAIYLADLRDSLFLCIPATLFALCVAATYLIGQAHYFGFFLSTLPEVLVDVLSMFALAFFFAERTAEAKRLPPHGRDPLLYFGAVLYAVIQVLQLLAFGRIQGKVQAFGFSLGLLAKILMFLGIIQLLVASTKALTQSAFEQRRMSELGNTIDLLAHELGTPISEILNRIDDLTRPSTVADAARKIESAASRADALLLAARLYRRSSILSPSRATVSQQGLEPDVLGRLQVISVNTLIEIAQTALRTTRQEKVAFRHQYAGHCCIDCVPNEIIQVLINLFRNSYDSFINGTGTIEIRTSNERRISDEAASGPVGVVRILVRDGGEGIPEANMAKVFETGFTTRTGIGRGHGLAVVKMLVEKNYGTIELRSPAAQGAHTKGTEVLLVFPRVGCDVSSYSRQAKGREAR